MKGYVANIEKQPEITIISAECFIRQDTVSWFWCLWDRVKNRRGDTRSWPIPSDWKRKRKAVLDGVEHQLEDGSAVVVPAGTKHNIINTSPKEEMKLYTIYSPPEHRMAWSIRKEKTPWKTQETISTAKPPSKNYEKIHFYNFPNFLVALSYFLWGRSDNAKYDFIVAQRQDVLQQV